MPRFEIKVSQREQDWADDSSPLQSVPGRAPLQSTPPTLTSPLQSTPPVGPTLQSVTDSPVVASSPLQCDPAFTALQCDTPDSPRAEAPLQSVTDDSPRVESAPLQCLDV